MTSTDELLWGHHIDNEDFKGADNIANSPAQLLKRSAGQYLDDAVASGEVTESRVYFIEHLGKFVGSTSVETQSGVKINKRSEGAFHITAEYDEDGADGVSHDLTVDVDLPENGACIVREDRQRREDGELTGEGGERTLPSSQRDKVLGQLTKLVWQTF